MRITSYESTSTTPMRRVRQLLAVLTLACIMTPAARAQGQVIARDAGADAEHTAQCRIAARFLETGTPTPRMPWARRTILDCGVEAPAALAAATRRLSASRDTADLNALLRAAQFVRDTGFFDAALEVASMPSASIEARAAGFLVAAMETTDRATFDLGEVLAESGPMMGCVGGRTDHSLRIAGGAPLSPDAVTRLRAAIAAVLAAPSESVVVRNAAGCASGVVGR